jgi:hypothetical protein
MEDNKDGKLGDLFKKVLTTGVTAAFMTEESVRALLKDMPLPKELVGSLLENARNTKTEFVSSIKNEMKSYLERIDISREVDRIVEKYDFEIKATISLKKKNQGKEKEKDKKLVT